MEELTIRIGKLKEMVQKAKHIACLTGAGMSTESGVPDFRSSTGIYKTLCSEEVFDIDRFNSHPEGFYKVMAPVYGAMLDAEPNAGHLELARWEKESGKEICVATQNIDGLHQRAGSRNVQEVHGSMMSLTCKQCGATLQYSAFVDHLRTGVLLRHSLAGSSCHGVMKPDIVFYGESLPFDAFETASNAFMTADLVLVLGTSLAVYPAAGLPDCRPRGSRLVIVNRSETPLDRKADLLFHEDIGKVLGVI
ncbi:MAG: NAD-dependent deacylase [Victivallales bacterium]|nr:NAD-dependent deacylase [Victivallales bacterium]